MTSRSARLLHRGEAQLGEGPLWDEDRQEVLWVDLLEGRIFAAAEQTGASARETYRADAGQTVSAVVQRRAGGFAVCLRERVLLLDQNWRAEGTIPIPGLGAGFRLSDACAGPGGELWVGVVADGDTAAAALADDPRGLYRVGPHGVDRVLERVGFSNGMGFAPDGNFHLVDSDAHTISSYRYDSATAALTEVLDVVEAPGAFGAPDGLAIDVDGGLWVAFFGGGTVRRYMPGARWVQRIDTGVDQVSSCAFVGQDRGLLAITTARVELDHRQLAEQPRSGSLLAADPGVRGAPRGKCDL